MAFKNALRSWISGLQAATADIEANAITNALLATMTRGTVKVGGAANAATDLNAKTSGQILVGDGTDLKSVAMSGDATLAASGALTIAALAVTGAKQSAVAATKHTEKTLLTFATTGAVEYTFIAPCAGTLSLVTLTGKDALTANDTNYLTFALTNKGQAGAGSTAMLSAVAGQATTKATAGQGLVAYGKCVVPLHATPANLVVAKGDTLTFSATATGTLANTVTEPSVQLEFAYTA